MDLTILRDLPHSALVVTRTGLEVRPCGIDVPPWRGEADAVAIHLYTADSGWIREYVRESQAEIAIIQSVLHLPPEDAVEVYLEAAHRMAHRALKFAILEGQDTALVDSPLIDINPKP